MRRFSDLHVHRMDNFIATLESQVYPEKPSQLHLDITHKAFEHLLRLVPLCKGMKVLDVGCGQGPALRLFEHAGTTAVGITLGAEDLAACRDQAFTVASMDQSFLEFEDETFDIIWARHVIEHSIFPYYTLHEFKRVLKQTGLLYLEMPAPDTDCHHERNLNHYSVLTRSAWTSLVERAGFIIADRVSYNFSVIAGKDEYFGFYCRKTA